MRKFVAVSIAAAMMASAGAAFASEALLKKGNCLGCHAMDKKMVGPSYKEVAAKYAGQAGAAEALAKKIKNGSKGVWGQMPMPANPAINEAESLELAKYVLSLK